MKKILILTISMNFIVVLPLFSQRFSIEDYFIHQRGKRRYTPTITVLGQQMDFYKKKNDLVNKAWNFVINVEREMKRNVQKLRKEGRSVLASHEEHKTFHIYEYLTEKFDNAFLKWDRYFVLMGDYLDSIDASTEDKEKLVVETVTGLENRINKIIANTKRELAQPNLFKSL